MRICLITKQYPTVDAEDAYCSYFANLAQGLQAKGHEVTVLCSSALKGTAALKDTGVRVVVAPASKRVSDLRLAGQMMPASSRFCSELLGYWQAMAEIGIKSFDVVEASEPLSGSLLSAFSREIPTVLRISEPRRWNGESFDQQFQKLVSDYAFACVDGFSCASSAGADYLRQTKMIDAQQISINSSSEPAELATNAESVYAAAVERFVTAKRPHLYRHGAERLIRSCEDMMVLYDRMIYDLLFRVSYRFRLIHWFSKFRSDPGAFTARVFQRFGQKA